MQYAGQQLQQARAARSADLGCIEVNDLAVFVDVDELAALAADVYYGAGRGKDQVDTAGIADNDTVLVVSHRVTPTGARGAARLNIRRFKPGLA